MRLFTCSSRALTDAVVRKIGGHHTFSVPTSSEAVPSSITSVGYTICSGVAIDKTRILTAAHCIKKDQLLRIKLGTGSENDSSAHQKLRIDDFSDGEAWTDVRVDSVDHERDVAVLVAPDGALQSAIDVGYPQLELNDEVFFVGYGSQQGKIGARHLRVGNVIHLEEEQIWIKSKPLGACVGDSGGGLFIERSEGIALVGTLVAGSRNCRGADKFIRAVSPNISIKVGEE